MLRHSCNIAGCRGELAASRVAGRVATPPLSWPALCRPTSPQRMSQPQAWVLGTSPRMTNGEGVPRRAGSWRRGTSRRVTCRVATPILSWPALCRPTSPQRMSLQQSWLLGTSPRMTIGEGVPRRAGSWRRGTSRRVTCRVATPILSWPALCRATSHQRMNQPQSWLLGTSPRMTIGEGGLVAAARHDP